MAGHFTIELKNLRFFAEQKVQQVLIVDASVLHAENSLFPLKIFFIFHF